MRFSTNLALNVAFFTFTMRYTLHFYIPKEKNTSKSGILEALPHGI